MTNLTVESVLDKLISANAENKIIWLLKDKSTIYAIRNGITVTLESMGFYVGSHYYHYTGNELKYNDLWKSAYHKSRTHSIDTFLE